MHLFLTLFIFAIFNCDFTNACPLPHGGSKINLLYKWGVCFSCSTKWSKANLQDSILETKEVEPTSSKKLRKKKKKKSCEMEEKRSWSLFGTKYCEATGFWARKLHSVLGKQVEYYYFIFWGWIGLRKPNYTKNIFDF